MTPSDLSLMRRGDVPAEGATKRRRPEDAAHIPILNWIRKHAPQCVVFHVPNGGSRNRLEAIRLKTLGTMPGVSDLIVVPPGGVIHAVEVKPEKGGTVTGEQKAFMRRIGELGGRSIVARSTEEVREAFKTWGIATL